ncbi:MAG: chain-length determining protein [Gammaproteobacteria bacterium]|nr:MAG: chain-length determining protein [Gammaproteobacteria bacterium]
MHELYEQLLTQLRGIWRFRWVIPTVAWVLFVAAAVVILRLPDEYRATATVYVDTHSILRPLLRGLAVTGNAEQRVRIMTKTLLTRPNLEKLMRMTDLDVKAATPAEREDLLDSLAARIRVESSRRGENLYKLSFEDPDRKLARKVVQALVSIFVEGLLGQSREDTDTAQKFLDRQLAAYAQRLNEAEKALADFKRKHVGMMPGEGKDYYASLKEEEEKLETARLQLRELENRRRVQRRQLAHLDEEESLFDLDPAEGGSLATPYDARIEALHQRLDELLLRFTDRHPDVIETRRLLAELEAKRKAFLAQARQEHKATGGSDPVRAQLQVLLSETESQIAALRTRVKAYEARVEKLRKMVDTIPKVEAQLKQLTRDYEVYKQQYEALLARRQQADISEKAEVSADDVKFRVVDPPHVPLTPSGPPRLLYLGLAVLGSLAAGVGLALLLHLLRPTFQDVRQLRDTLHLPVFGSVSIAVTDEIRRKRRMEMLSFGTIVLLLFGFYGMALFAELFQLGIIRQLHLHP